MKDVEIIQRLPRDQPVPPRINTKVSRINAKPAKDRTPDELALLKAIAERSFSKKTKFMFEEEESSGPSSEMAVASVYSTAIAEHKDLAQTFLKSIKEVSKDGIAALVDVSKAQQRALDNASEREELCMERLRKEQKRADKYESKYRKLRDEVEDLEREIAELKTEKQDEGTLSKIIEIGSKLYSMKQGSPE